MSATPSPGAEVFARALGARRAGPGRWRARSVCHGGDGWNLSISTGRDGRPLFKCFSAGCEYRQIAAAVEARTGLSLRRALSADERRAELARIRERERGEAKARERDVATALGVRSLRRAGAMLVNELAEAEADDRLTDALVGELASLASLRRGLDGGRP